MPFSSPAALTLAALVCGGCSTRETRAPAPASPNVVTVLATEYRFDAPDTVPAGLTTLHLVTQGKEMHQVALYRISGGRTYADFVEQIKKAGPPPPWVARAGGVNPPRAGGAADVTLPLDAGRYALLCFVPAPDGVPHLVRGMMRALTVVPSRRPSAPEPLATDTLTLSDYAFVTSAPITAGTHTFRVVNLGPQDHEVIFARLLPGKSAKDMVEWFYKPTGVPPGEPIGGVFAFGRDQHAFVTVEFTPGEYALICFIPDATDGQPHFVHGMVRQVTVR